MTNTQEDGWTAEMEREAIMAWLRAEGRRQMQSPWHDGTVAGGAMQFAADEIQHGAHLNQKGQG